MRFDPLSPENLADPYPAYRALRDHEPVHFSQKYESFVLSRYDDVRGALADPQAELADKETLEPPVSIPSTS